MLYRLGTLGPGVSSWHKPPTQHGSEKQVDKGQTGREGQRRAGVITQKTSSVAAPCHEMGIFPMSHKLFYFFVFGNFWIKSKTMLLRFEPCLTEQHEFVITRTTSRSMRFKRLMRSTLLNPLETRMAKQPCRSGPVFSVQFRDSAQMELSFI